MERDDGPWRGEVWTHIRTLGKYAVVGRATNRDPDGPPDGLVVYRRLHQGAYYVRTLANFRERFVYQYGPTAAVAAAG